MRGKGLDFPHPRHSGMVAVVLPGPGRVGGADSQQSETDVRFILHTSIQQVWPGYPCSDPVKDDVFAERFMNFKDLFPSLKPSFDPVPLTLSLIHISEPTRLGMISYAVFCLK